MDYRTNEQFEELCENMLNGNWTDAAHNCVDYGFYANDLKNAYEENPENCPITDIWDFVEVVEMAEKLRSME